jgi:hypothetical protein|nr:MAG TPA: hypothetical protein [Bacteriophage sp.]
MAQNSIGKDIGSNIGGFLKNLVQAVGQGAVDVGTGLAKGVGKAGTFAVDTAVNAADIA